MPHPAERVLQIGREQLVEVELGDELVRAQPSALLDRAQEAVGVAQAGRGDGTHGLDPMRRARTSARDPANRVAHADVSPRASGGASRPRARFAAVFGVPSPVGTTPSAGVAAAPFAACGGSLRRAGFGGAAGFAAAGFAAAGFARRPASSRPAWRRGFGAAGFGAAGFDAPASRRPASARRASAPPACGAAGFGAAGFAAAGFDAAGFAAAGFGAAGFGAAGFDAAGFAPPASARRLRLRRGGLRRGRLRRRRVLRRGLRRRRGGLGRFGAGFGAAGFGAAGFFAAAFGFGLVFAAAPAGWPWPSRRPALRSAGRDRALVGVAAAALAVWAGLALAPRPGGRPRLGSLRLGLRLAPRWPTSARRRTGLRRADGVRRRAGSAGGGTVVSSSSRTRRPASRPSAAFGRDLPRCRSVSSVAMAYGQQSAHRPAAAMRRARTQRRRRPAPAPPWRSAARPSRRSARRSSPRTPPADRPSAKCSSSSPAKRS